MRIFPESIAGCFLAGTLVSLANGSRLPIERLGVGDKVLSPCVGQAVPATNVVTRVTSHSASKHMVINGALRLTPRQPVYTDRGWLRAVDITASVLLHGRVAELVRVESVEECTGSVVVHNLHLAKEPHTFYANGIIVHNNKAVTVADHDLSSEIPTPDASPIIRFGNLATLQQSQTDGGRQDTVHFSAFCPRQVHMGRRYGLLTYAHMPSEAESVEVDARRFRDDLGEEMPGRQAAERFCALAKDTPITVVPECQGIVFEPGYLTKRWQGQWIRFSFDFRLAEPEVPHDALLVRVSVLVGGMEVAHIPYVIDVTPAGEPLQRTPRNRLAAAKERETVSMYHKVFVSYSRKDRDVAELYRLAQLAIGNEVFLDAHSIRAGENWEAALARAIDDADIFQLFWSEHSAASPNVREEWEYALMYRCRAREDSSFVRPVYWEAPINPSPPPELHHLNFRYVPLRSFLSSGG